MIDRPLSSVTFKNWPVVEERDATRLLSRHIVVMLGGCQGCGAPDRAFQAACKRQRHAGVLAHLCRAMEVPGFIEMWVKVRSGWADDEARVRSFGYE